MTRMMFWQTGQRSGSVCQTCIMMSRHFLEGRRRGGGGIILGRKGLDVASIAELGWRPPRGRRFYLGPKGFGCGFYPKPGWAAARHLVAVPAIVTHHLNPLVRNM